MADRSARTPSLSPDEVDTVDDVVAFHHAHHEATTGAQHLIDSVTGALGRPVALLVVIGLLALGLGLGAWRGADVLSVVATWIEFAATVSALLVSMIILITQRRENDLAERRAQLTLELALLSDRKNAKIISLLEELRRDAPGVTDRIDRESEDMAAPADLGSVAHAIDSGDRS